MGIYDIPTIKSRISGNSYVGRGIIIGKTNNNKAVVAYFIMGRSENSRNRIFKKVDDQIFTEPYDVSKVEDPSLIIYSAIKGINNSLIATNGDQTDTIYNFIKDGKTFEDALKTRCFEPDSPNFTPRISGILNFTQNNFTYKMSILKSIDEKGSDTARYFYEYPSISGLGHFIHTYVQDGNPIPTFQGEPERVAIYDDIDTFANEIWENLDKDNKISLVVRYIDLETNTYEERLINKNGDK